MKNLWEEINDPNTNLYLTGPNFGIGDRITRMIGFELGKVVSCKITIINDCQDEPRLIATTPEEADEILDMWEAGR